MRFLKSCGLVVENGYVVWSEPVKAFMKLDRERGSILKKGSRTGYLENLEN